ncbi:Gfo/Idh/MocA family protein [Alteribacillus sp. HJP-4]|uniref:Gfo/Idh/MocA family protein n=1 Tax=Alteribacillus sp. HJP-4 TaxID=2775394 RepID=UPI0035CD324A
MKKVRIGVIGIGNMGTAHALSLYHQEIPGAEIAAVADVREERLAWAENNLNGVQLFNNEDDFFQSDGIDAIIIAVPHGAHPRLAAKAFERGLHVLCEKPAGIHTKQVKEMNQKAIESNCVFSMMFNQRTSPLYQKVRDLVRSGELGEVKRINWIITNWYRSQSYYDSGGWRATWEGEGGGVLINQSPHQLDLWQWITGMMPSRIRAFCYFGKNRDIEVEDEVTAFAEYENGATGVFITSTGEAPGTNRLEITGERGKIVVEDSRLTFWRLRVPEPEFNKQFTGGFGEPECWKCEVPVTGKETGHHGILKNFSSAVLHGEPLLAPGEEGLNSLTLSNAMQLSAWTDNWVELPFDGDLYLHHLQENINKSTVNKKDINLTLNVDNTH